MPSYNDTLRYLYGLERHGIKPGLGRIKRLLSALKDPHLCYPSVHVAGTNGKGSTAAMLHSMLSAAGFRAALYTSPHLMRFNERIRLSRPISDKDVLSTASAVRRAARACGVEDRVSFFEFTTAMAFLYFREKKAGFAVIETGMGGRWDATNVVTPLVSIITTIGLDHAEFLGENLTAIAGEKAGIIKRGVPLVTGADRGPALRAILSKAETLSSAAYVLDRDFLATPAKGRFDYRGMRMSAKGLKTGLVGAHQVKNAACALAATEILRQRGFNIHLGAIRRGLKDVKWPGRLEAVCKSPLVMLDAAHNPQGALALKDALKALDYERLILVLGIMADKDIGGILGALAPIADSVILTAPGTKRAADPEHLKKRLKGLSKDSAAITPVNAACREALRRARAEDAVVITGSIYTIGEAKAFFKGLR